MNHLLNTVALLTGLGLGGNTLAAGSQWIIATQDETVQAGSALQLEAIRPDDSAAWPETLKLRLYGAAGQAEILELHAEAANSPASSRRTYKGTLSGNVRGLIRAELADLHSNRLALVAQSSKMEANPAARDPIDSMISAPSGTLDPLPDEEPALSANEPMYFVLGKRDGTNARFQLSFKYRLFDPESAPARLLPFLGQMHLGYTQTSLWDLSGDSKPFRDTSYRPSLFWQGKLEAPAPLFPSLLRGGYEHESNGKEGSASRSIDMLFLQPAWRTDFANGSSLIFAPRFHNYLDKADNPDIARYRGYADWIIRVGHERGWMLSSRLRQGTGGYASGQFDLSMPLREPLFSRTGGFLHFQLFTGYGESLLDYNIKQPPQFRVGFSIVR